MIRATLFLTVLIFLSFLLIQNKDMVVAIQYYPGGPTNLIPHSLFALGTFFLGIILSLILIFPGWLKLKLESRRQKKEIESLIEEVGQMRKAFSSSNSIPSSSPSQAETFGPQ